MRAKYSVILFFLGFIACNCETEEDQFGFLGGDGSGTSDSFNASSLADAFNTTAIGDAIQDMVNVIQEPIGDIMKAIQEPIGDQIDAFMNWIGVDDKEKANDDGAADNNKGNEEAAIESKNQHHLRSASPDANEEGNVNNDNLDEPTDLIEPAESILIAELKEPIEVIEPAQEPIVSNVFATHVQVDESDTDEIVVIVTCEDLGRPTKGENISVINSEDDQPFFVRFFELFLGKEVEIEMKHANLIPREGSLRGQQNYFLKRGDDGL